MSKVRFLQHINPDYKELATSMMQELLEGKIPSKAEVIYDGRNTLWRLKQADTAFVIKSFRRPNAINSVAYTTVRRSKARRSYENAKRLLEMGFETPTPVAWGEVRRDGRLDRSYYVCLEQKGEDLRYWERRPDAEPLLRALGAEMVRLHRAGVWHKDFSPGNIIVLRDGEREEYKFSYIDLNRMQFCVRNHRKLMSMFGTLNEEAEVRRLAHFYAEAAGIDSIKTESEASEAYTRFMRRIIRKRRLKSIWKELWKR